MYLVEITLLSKDESEAKAGGWMIIRGRSTSEKRFIVHEADASKALSRVLKNITGSIEHISMRNLATEGVESILPDGKSFIETLLTE